MMERLTRAHYKASDGHYLVCSEMCEREDCTEECGHFDEAIERLAAYEDTGLTPEEVLPKDKADEIALKLMRLADLESFCSYTRLRELAEADKDGRLAVLPCKDWLDIVFGEQVLFWGIDGKRVVEISVDDANRITWYNGWKSVTIIGFDECGDDWEFYAWDIGETVFLTREEAEKALGKKG